MNFFSNHQMTQSLLVYLTTSALIRPEYGLLGQDEPASKGSCIYLKCDEPEVEREYIDGTKTFRMPFKICYRHELTLTDNESICRMILTDLNYIGFWMDEVMSGPRKPVLADWMTVTRFEQVKRASIVREEEFKEDNFVTYMAEYVLGYQTK